MHRTIAAAAVALTLAAGGALAQETSLGWYEDNWEATTFPDNDGGMACSVDARADNLPDADGAWIFVHPSYIQFAPNGGLPPDGVGTVTVDRNPPIPMEIFQGQVGYVDDADDLPLLQAMAQGEEMTISVWSASAPDRIDEYVYPLAGFREAYQRIADECRFDPAEVLTAAAPLTNGAVAPSTDDVAPQEDGGSSLFGRGDGK